MRGFAPPLGRACSSLSGRNCPPGGVFFFGKWSWGSPLGDCAHSGRGFFPFQESGMFPLPGDGDCAPFGGGGEFSFQETGCAPHFFFSLPEKKKRAAGRACACAVLGRHAVRSAFFATRRLLKCAKMHCGKLASLCFFFRCCCAMRWCGAGEICDTVHTFLLCVGCSGVQGCTACSKVAPLYFPFRCC